MASRDFNGVGLHRRKASEADAPAWPHRAKAHEACALTLAADEKRRYVPRDSWGR